MEVDERELFPCIKMGNFMYLWSKRRITDLNQVTFLEKMLFSAAEKEKSLKKSSYIFHYG